ncbi:MAG: ABC transporter substrate-binding protein, partial [Bacteroidales bacterium]|nr:ABC transporter substrate-binding protein [Bacteroidales bacterium]
TVVASAIKVNIEKVVTQKPDLVIATTITNQETIQSLEKFGIKTEVFPTPRSYEEICNQFDRLTLLTGKKYLGDRLLKQNNNSIDSIRNAIAGKKGSKVFFQVGAKPLFTVPGNNFMDDYITYIGCENITAKLKNGNITRETVIKSNPDYIFITTMGIMAEEEKKIWESMQDLEAAKNGNIYTIDADMVCTPTPFTFKQTLEEMVRCIYFNEDK